MYSAPLELCTSFPFTKMAGVPLMLDGAADCSAATSASWVPPDTHASKAASSIPAALAVATSLSFENAAGFSEGSWLANSQSWYFQNCPSSAAHSPAFAASREAVVVMPRWASSASMVRKSW
jgi:hypothetical protein